MNILNIFGGGNKQKNRASENFANEVFKELQIKNEINTSVFENTGKEILIEKDDKLTEANKSLAGVQFGTLLNKSYKHPIQKMPYEDIVAILYGLCFPDNTFKNVDEIFCEINKSCIFVNNEPIHQILAFYLNEYTPFKAGLIENKNEIETYIKNKNKILVNFEKGHIIYGSRIIKNHHIQKISDDFWLEPINFSDYISIEILLRAENKNIFITKNLKDEIPKFHELSKFVTSFYNILMDPLQNSYNEFSLSKKNNEEIIEYISYLSKEYQGLVEQIILPQTYVRRRGKVSRFIFLMNQEIQSERYKQIR